MEAKDFKIDSINRLTGQLYRMELEGSFTKPPVPGQFIHIKIDNLFLRRPFSIAEYKNNLFTILFKVVGEGTKILSTAKEGDRLNVIGPLGKGFQVKKDWKSAFLVGGGTGIAPLIFLTETLLKEKVDVVFFYGARSRDDIAFNILGCGINCIFTTEDGSYGEKGLLTPFVETHIKKEGRPDVLFSGGPYGLLKEIGRISEKYEIPAFVSMENRMACATGLCYGCVTKIKTQEGWEYKRVCMEGPVFNTKVIEWE